MKITKMESLGNDFIVVDYQKGVSYEKLAPKILNRRLGVGGDLLIAVKNDPLEMLCYNTLGKREDMSTNALACFTKYAHDLRLFRGNSANVLTTYGMKEATIEEEIPFLAKVNLGIPNYNNQMLYVNDSLSCMGRIIKANGIEVNTYSVSLGGCNTVVFIDSFRSKYLELAEAIAMHSLFKRHTNVTFCQVINKLNIKCRTYEYDKGFVLSNADGCSSAMVIARELNLVKGKVHAEVDNGSFYIEIGKKNNVYIKTPARYVFTGEYNEEEI